MNHSRTSAPATARAPKAVRPATTLARPAAAMHHPGAALQHAGTAEHAALQHTGIVEHAALHRGVRPASLAESEYVASPFCERCGTDEFIYLETFVPATHRRDGSVSKLGEVTYFCSGCDDFSAHAVPASWVPPGWYFG